MPHQTQQPQSYHALIALTLIHQIELDGCGSALAHMLAT